MPIFTCSGGSPSTTRTRAGVVESALEPAPDLDALVEVQAGRARLTRAGRLMANEVALRLR